MLATVQRKLFCNNYIKNLIIHKRKLNYLNRIKTWYNNKAKPKEPKPPYNHVCQLGDPILKTKAELVQIEKIQSTEIQKIINSLIQVMRSYKAVGLAAPQIGVPLKIFATEYPESYKKHIPKEVQKIREVAFYPLKVFINPEIQVVNPQKITFPEACESVRGFSGSVARFYEVEISGYNECGIHHSWKVKGWPARIIQHECDHLDGKMYTDLMDIETFQNDCWHWINVTRGKFRLCFL